MKLTREETLHIAKLVKLNLSEDEVEKLSGMLSQAIDYIAVLNELDTQSTPETYQVNGLTNIFQKDTDTSTTLSQEDSLLNAKEQIKNMFATEAVFKR